LSLQLDLDDCAYAKQLATLLRAAGHRVVTPADAGTSGMADDVHLQYAAQHGLILVTRDCDDFAVLHPTSSAHAGIVAIYQDNDPDRDMTYGEIVRALANMENAGLVFAGEFHVLNAWRY
jgi:predicted nuclease of predicted toxin-antitoxin system